MRYTASNGVEPEASTHGNKVGRVTVAITSLYRAY
uniref:Uncharacterized protein n=1 Tax=mine drainage metagenome TaxID=410659 RepID=E6QIQ1_9ZZZZ